jgi:hypothetical protein
MRMTPLYCCALAAFVGWCGIAGILAYQHVGHAEPVLVHAKFTVIFALAYLVEIKLQPQINKLLK